MKYTEALKMIYEIMENRPDIKEIKFDRDNDSFDVISSDGHIHMCFGKEFRNIKFCSKCGSEMRLKGTELNNNISLFDIDDIERLADEDLW